MVIKDNEPIAEEIYEVSKVSPNVKINSEEVFSFITIMIEKGINFISGGNQIEFTSSKAKKEMYPIQAVYLRLFSLLINTIYIGVRINYLSSLIRNKKTSTTS